MLRANLDILKQNECSTGTSKGSFTLKKSLEDGFSKGFEVSNKITKKSVVLCT